MDEKKRRRTVSAARLYWAIMDACERHNVGQTNPINELLDALKDDNMEAAR